MEVTHVPTAALLRSLQWVSWYRSRSAELAAVIRNLVPSAHTQSARVRGCVVTNVLLSVGVWLPMSCCPWVRGYQCLAVRGCLLSVATQPPIAAPNQRRVPQPPIADPQRRISQPTIAAHQSAPCPDGTRIYQKPTASSEGAQLWDKHPLSLSWFRKAGPTIILNIIQDV